MEVFKGIKIIVLFIAQYIRIDYSCMIVMLRSVLDIMISELRYELHIPTWVQQFTKLKTLGLGCICFGL